MGYNLTADDRTDREKAINEQTATQNRASKLLVMLSSGGIVTVFGFIGTAGIESVRMLKPWSLWVALLFWCVCLTLHLVEPFLADKAFAVYIDAIDEGDRQTGWNNWWAKAVIWLCRVSFVCFLCGLGFAGAFIYSIIFK